MAGDNFKVEIHSAGKDHFTAAVKLAWTSAPGGKATHYVSPVPEHVCDKCHGKGNLSAWFSKENEVIYPCDLCGRKGEITSKFGIVLLWHEDFVRGVKSTLLPYPLNADAGVDFLWNWINNVEYVDQPDHDGSNGKGFIVTTGDFWGHVEGSHHAFIGVYPNWQMYGK